LKQSFISAEDKNFYTHLGVDPEGIARAAVRFIQNYGSGRRPEGASTITQQVAKNFLLTNELRVERKIKEAILALRIEQAYTKDEILELYLNEIYFGFGAYGVAAASLIYFRQVRS
jgi:penicillin-binding protein 1A